jgi:hypothetical protein
MPTPSLLIVPSRWKTGSPGKLYSQIPTNGNGDFNVTGVVTGGTSIGTRVNNIGYIEPITTSGTPRLDYYTSSGTPGCPALLVEPSGTNLCLQSADFNTTWAAQSSATVNTNTAISPDGTQNADTINLAAVVDSRISQTITVANSTTYTISCFYKNIALTAGQTFNMRFNNFASVPNNLLATATIDLVAGTATFAIGGTAGTGFSGTATGRIENYGDGWYRVSMTFTVGTAGGNAGGFQPAQVGSATARSFYVWGAQLETGSVATSYIPTTTGTVTRAADIISVSGGVSGSIGQTEGTIYLDFSTIVGSNSNVIFALGDSGSGQNRLRILGNASRELRFIFQLNGNVTQYDFVRIGAVTSLTDFKIAIAYKSGDIAVAINGVLANTASSGLTFNGPLNSVELSAATVGFLTQRYRAVALHTTRLTNADLVLLTLPGNNTYLPQAIWDNYLSRTGNSEVPDCLYTRHADLLDV